jgi:hypothetical protein
LAKSRGPNSKLVKLSPKKHGRLPAEDFGVVRAWAWLEVKREVKAMEAVTSQEGHETL